VSIDDPQNLVSQDTEQQLNASAHYVMDLIQNHISWQGVLDAEIQIRPHSENPWNNIDGILPSIVSLSWNGSVWSNDALHEMRTGVDRKPSEPDIGCTIYLSQSGEIKNYGSPVWFDPYPSQLKEEVSINPALPPGHFDFIGVFTHEVFHGLGFARHSHEYADLTTSIEGVDFFIGQITQEVHGGPLPLAATDLTIPEDHYGNTGYSDNDVPSGLMYQWGNYELNRLDIGKVDLAVLEDLGVTVHTYAGLPNFDVIDSQMSEVLADPPLATLNRSEGSNLVTMSWSAPENLGVRDNVGQTLQGYQILVSMDGPNSTYSSWQESELIPPSINEVIIEEPLYGFGWAPEYRIVALTESGRGFTGTPVLQHNPAPTLDPLPDLAIAEDSLEQVILLTGISAGEGGILPVQVFATSSNTDLIPDPTVTQPVTWWPFSTASLTLMPVADAYGVATIAVTVEDAGPDGDFATKHDNATVSRTFDVTVTPVNDSPTMDALGNPVWYGDELQDKQITFYVGGITAGGTEYSQPLRISGSSSNPDLVSPPEPRWLPAPSIFPPNPYVVEVTYTIKAGYSGTSTIALTVEDGGFDLNLSTSADNAFLSRESVVTVLLVIAGEPTVTEAVNKVVEGDKVLARDKDGFIYVDGERVMHNNVQLKTAPEVFRFISVDVDASRKALVVETRRENRLSLLCQTDWSVGDFFHALSNEAPTVLNPVSRQPLEFALTVVPGAYVIDSLTNPTLTVHRGQKVTFDLNVTGHPFYLQTTGGGYVPTNVYTEGFSGNGETSGQYEWIVPEDAPDELFYQCEFHPVMFGKIVVVD